MILLFVNTPAFHALNLDNGLEKDASRVAMGVEIPGSPYRQR